MDQRTHIVPVILSGGAGLRLWPVSTGAKPKQFHALGGPKSMFAQTAERVAAGSDVAFAPPLVLCGQSHLTLAQAALAEVGAVGARFLLEPIARNTAPALTVAALLQAQSDPDALMLVLPADHIIARPEVLREACRLAAPFAAAGAIVTFGIVPDGPETGYGYIKRGAALGAGIYRLDSFREKPDIEVARAYLAEGSYAWNAGIFLFRASALIAELDKHASEILSAAKAALQAAKPHGADAVLLDLDAFAASPAVSIDYAVMEHTQFGAIVPVDMGWSDVGSFATLWDLGDKDSAGNVATGPAFLADSQGCLVRAEGLNVAMIGVTDLMVIATETGVLIVPRERAQDVRWAAEHFKSPPKP